jgi:CheY-like chemotaxis protein
MADTGQKKKILIIDDSATTREYIRSLLQNDYETLLAADGAEGLQVALAEKPDAVVADLQMPVMDGLGFLRAFRATPHGKDVPVVVATTVTSIDKVNECHALGCVGFVLKPLRVDYLLAKLARMVNRPRGS